MMKVVLLPLIAIFFSAVNTEALAQNPAFEICSKLASSGLVNRSERRFAEETASQQWHEICRERYTRVVKSNSASASLKAKIYKYGDGKGTYGKTGTFDQTDVDNFCDKGAEGFTKFIAEQESVSIGQYLADSVNTCVEQALRDGVAWTGGFVELDPGADDRFIVDLKHIPGRTAEKYKLEQLVGSSGVECFLDGGLQKPAIGVELSRENAYSCRREAGQPVAARLIFVGIGDRSNTFNVPIRATSTSAIERLKMDLLKELLPANAIVPFMSDSCPTGWKELSVPGHFLVGAAPTQRSGEQGGSRTVTLSENNLPRHQHAVYHHAGYPRGIPTDDQKYEGAAGTDKQTSVNPGVTSDGGFPNKPFDIMPPWIAVRYCQRSEMAPIASGR